ncbi:MULTISPECIES: hypothetical protein [Brucella/Ochrobactrum group]|nr:MULTISPECIES: hypothetical protein [Brucella/Ochrobactrum group]MBA8840864.1 hypothetical protein [Ochrobactrum sp. RH2CCR150]MCQ9147556.1 hypothetical protein [Ochrobactrum sp. BTU2]
MASQPDKHAPLTEDEDIKFLAENSDLSPLQARDLIDRLGHRDRPKLLAEARKFKAES